MLKLPRLFSRKRSRPAQQVLVTEIARNLIDANRLLRKLGVRSWLTDGTLLGYYRENRILPYDNDADLGLFISEYSNAITAEFISAGWELAHVYGRLACGLQLSFRRNSAAVDLFFFYQEEDKFWHGAWKPERKGKVRNLIKYYYEPFEFQEVDFLGEQFTVPAETAKYIAAKYGDDWEVPQEDWDWAFGPANAIGTEIRLPRNKRKRIG